MLTRNLLLLLGWSYGHVLSLTEFAGVIVSRLYHLLAEAQLPGLNTFEIAEMCSHMMRTTLTTEEEGAVAAVACHQKNGGLSIMVRAYQICTNTGQPPMKVAPS